MVSEMLSTLVLIALLTPQASLIAYFLVGVAVWLFLDDYCDRYAKPWPVSPLTGIPIPDDSLLYQFVITAATWPAIPKWVLQHQRQLRTLPKMRASVADC